MNFQEEDISGVPKYTLLGGEVEISRVRAGDLW
jgi:hypothetical protein